MLIERRVASDGKIGTAITLYVIDWAHQEKLSTLAISF